MSKKTISVVLAGGQGSRLNPLTAHRAKPAVPFAGKYRIIDFVLANLFNSGMRNILVLTQYAPGSLFRHIQTFWIPLTGLREKVQLLSPKMRSPYELQYRGTADAVWQNWESITREGDDAQYVAIFGGDHIYTMNTSQVVDFHKEKGAAFTVCAIRVPIESASNKLGVLRVDKDHRVIDFVEKPSLANVPQIPGHPGFCYASMGNYVANIDILGKALSEDAKNTESTHDFGNDLIPQMHRDGLPVYAYPFDMNIIEGQVGHYWRDVGTLVDYYQASLETLEFVPPLDLVNPNWLVPSYPDNLPSARFVGRVNGICHVTTAGGTVVDDANIKWSVLGRYVNVQKEATVEGSILFDGVVVGQRSYLKKVICDKDVRIPDDIQVGINRKEDEKRGFHTEPLSDEEWITVIPKWYKF